MDGRSENKNTKNAGMVDYYTRHAADFVPKLGLNESWMKFVGLHTEVNSKDRLAQMGNKGKVKAKAVAREDVHIPTMMIGGAIYSLGLDTKNQELISFFNFQDSYLRKMRDMDFLNLTKTTLSTGNLNILALGKFEITTQIMLDYEADVNEYEISLGKRVSGQKEIKNVNDEIEDLLRQMEEVIKKELNKRMLPFKTSNPTLYNEYLLLREISDEGIRHEEKAETGTTTAATEQPK